MYTQNEDERRKFTRQTERETLGQLKAQNKLLKAENRKFKAPETKKVRNYAIKEEEPATPGVLSRATKSNQAMAMTGMTGTAGKDDAESLLKFFSSQNKDL